MLQNIMQKKTVDLHVKRVVCHLAKNGEKSD